MKRKVKLTKLGKAMLFLIILILICIIFNIINTHRETKNIKVEEKVTKSEKVVKKDLNDVKEEIKEVQEEITEEFSEEPAPVLNVYDTRMTSFYPAESSDCTGSGLCSWDFEVNEHGWYTYQGKLVVATATQYLANQGWYLADGVHTFRYYDEITLVIDGVEYQAIVLDSCGNSMKTDRIDLFVIDANSIKDTQISVKY